MSTCLRHVFNLRRHTKIDFKVFSDFHYYILIKVPLIKVRENNRDKAIIFSRISQINH